MDDETVRGSVETCADTVKNIFDPLLCFARRPDQTPSEVFDMIQERMATTLGTAVGSMPKDDLERLASRQDFGKPMVDTLLDWKNNDMVFTMGEFERLAKPLGFFAYSVLGEPEISYEARVMIKAQFLQHLPYTRQAGKQMVVKIDQPSADSPDTDIVKALVILEAMNKIDEMVLAFRHSRNIA